MIQPKENRLDCDTQTANHNCDPHSNAELLTVLTRIAEALEEQNQRINKVAGCIFNISCVLQEQGSC